MILKKAIALLVLAAPFLASCGNGSNSSVCPCPISSAEAQIYNLTFHQTVEGPIKDKTIQVTVGKTTIEQVWGQEPEINGKAGYEAVWEDYSIDGKTSDFSVTPVYSPIEYTVTFINRVSGAILGSQKFTVETAQFNLPELPTEIGYTYAWESYTISASNMNVYCDRTANLHIARFYEDAEKTKKVGEDVIFSIETESLPEPEVPVHDGYDGSWGTYRLDLDQDIDIIAQYEVHGYYIQFTADGENVGEPVRYTVADAYGDLVKPEVPEKTGYTGAWPSEVTYELKELNDPQVVEAVYSANTYTITYALDDGTILGTSEATYDAEYTLRENETDCRWFNGDDRMDLTGTWTIPSDVTLVAKSRFEYVDFESADDSDVLFATAGSDASHTAIVDDAILGKCLRFETTTTYMRANLKDGALDKMFSKPEVKEIRFDAKSSATTNDFRHTHNGSNITYENNVNGWGINTTWKTFAFTREMYNDFKSGANESLIYLGSVTAGTLLYIDNIRTATTNLNEWGFENSRLIPQDFSSDYTHKVSYRSMNESKEVFVAQGSPIASYDFDYSIKSEGNRSMRVTKENGYVACFFLKAYSLLDANTVLQFDLYSTIGANATVGNFIDGYNNQTYPSHVKNEWVTYTVTKSQIESGGRFLIIQGSTAGDWYFDNFRLATVD